VEDRAATRSGAQRRELKRFKIPMKVVLALGLLVSSPALVQAQTASVVGNPVPRPVEIRELGAGVSFPIPPAQNAPWIGTNDAFDAIVQRLFKAGLADPRGLEYREVEFLAALGTWRREGETGLPSRAFVLPSSDPNARFAVAWDGQIYRVWRVGEVKDWRADVLAMRGPDYVDEPGVRSISAAQNIDFSTATVLKAVLAERLGAPRSLFSEIQLKGAALMFVVQFAGRATRAHVWGDDVTALALLRREKFARVALREAFETPKVRSLYFYAPALLSDNSGLRADQERRARERAAPKVFPDALSRLIDDLQNVDAEQVSWPDGKVSFVDDKRVRALVEMDESAVSSLIETIANDNRLTRVYQDYDSGGGWFLPVSMAAYDALTEIWGVRRFQTELFGNPYGLTNPQKRAEIVAKLRAYAAKESALPPNPLFTVLEDDAATPLQWLHAIQRLNNGPEQTTSFIESQPGARFVPGQGKPLRAKRNPSVSDLVERRALQVSQQAIAAPIDSASIDSMSRGNALLMELAYWDLPRALPLFLPQIQRIQKMEELSPSGHEQSIKRFEAYTRLRFLNAGFEAPKGEQRQRITNDYAAWLRAQPFGSLDSRFYSPLWHSEDGSALAKVAQLFFGAPSKPFEELLRGRNLDSQSLANGLSLLSAPALQGELFRGAVLRELDNQTEVATLSCQSQNFKVRFASGYLMEGQIPLSDLPSRAPDGAPLRVCDVVASGFGVASPNGQYEPALQLWWPQARRDAAIALIKKRLETIETPRFGF